MATTPRLVVVVNGPPPEGRELRVRREALKVRAVKPATLCLRERR
jgi:hypothetical protein